MKLAEPETKPFYRSRTLWGLALMLLARAFPKLGFISADIVDVVMTITGLTLGLVGRLTAKKDLALKKEKEF